MIEASFMLNASGDIGAIALQYYLTMRRAIIPFKYNESRYA